MARRARSSSLVLETIKPGDTYEGALDEGSFVNLNSQWVNYKGAWVIHVVLILASKILTDVIPGVRQEVSWTIVNLGYNIVSFIMFHWVTGIPFESNAGIYDNLTLWEQIDDGAQYTPARKWLTSVPIILFLVSTHYTRYNLTLFFVNFVALVISVCAKLPQLHRLRIKLVYDNVTPIESRPQTPKMGPFGPRMNDSTSRQLFVLNGKEGTGPQSSSSANLLSTSSTTTGIESIPEIPTANESPATGVSRGGVDRLKGMQRLRVKEKGT